MLICFLLALLRALHILHHFQVPLTAFCFLDRTKVIAHGHAYCFPTAALDLLHRFPLGLRGLS